MESELHTEHESDTVLIDPRVVLVRQTFHILDMEQFEYVVNTQSQFHIRSFSVHNDGVTLVVFLSVGIFSEVTWEIEELRVGEVGLSRIVLVGERSPKDVESNQLTPLQFF